MTYEVSICSLKSGPTAVVRTALRPGASLGDTILASLDRVYQFLEQSSAQQAGLNIVLYARRPESDWVDLEAGVQVAETFPGDGEVICSRTPGGRAATTTHRGPYENLVRAHEAVQSWCAAQGLTTGDTNWEVYGHWDPDPARQRTDVYYALDAGA